MIERLKARIAKELAEFGKRNTQPNYDQQASMIVLMLVQERLAELREWRERHRDRKPEG